MFIDQNDVVTVTVYYKKSRAHYTAYSQRDFEKKVPLEEERKKYTQVNVQMRVLTWELYNNINEAAVIKTQNNDRDWNYKLYKENKIKSIIAGWDAKKKGENGELVPVPVNNETIMRMAPEIAEAILSEYDSIMTLDDEEEKK